MADQPAISRVDQQILLMKILRKILHLVGSRSDAEQHPHPLLGDQVHAIPTLVTVNGLIRQKHIA